MRRPALIVLAALLTGCTAELKERNTALAEQVARLQGEAQERELEAAKLRLQVEDLKLERARYRLAQTVGIDPAVPLFAELVTDVGTILCELTPALTPETVANFVGLAEGTKAWRDPESGELVERPLYDGTLFFRVIEDEVVQVGDPTNTGRGGPGFTIPDEFHPDLTHVAGALAMANRGPETGGSQFYVALKRLPNLDLRHTVFGSCENLDIAEEISRGELEPGPQSLRPKDPVALRRVVIHRGAKPK
jgi:peptidyl-prolyl cis-trans isomerase A (cyclophilin A)